MVTSLTYHIHPLHVLVFTSHADTEHIHMWHVPIFMTTTYIQIATSSYSQAVIAAALCNLTLPIIALYSCTLWGATG